MDPASSESHIAFSCRSETVLPSFLDLMTSTLLKIKGHLFYMMPLSLAFAISLWLDSGYNFLAGISQK